MVIERAKELFRRRFGASAAVVVRAPGRVNLIGEHVDYADGVVLPIAIERETVVAMRATAGPSVVRSEAAGESEFDLAEARPSCSLGVWTAYVLGPLRELVEAGVGGGNVEIAIASDVPLGAGVSSSAALEVAVALAYTTLSGATIEPLDLARLCQRAEHRWAGTPCGIMDMTASLCARAGHALLLDCRTLDRTLVPMPAGASVLVIDSGVRHRLSDGGYAARRALVEEAARRLGVPALRDATRADLDAAGLSGRVADCARHVVTEIERTCDAAEACRGGDVVRLGRLMDESHASLRDDFRVSVPEIDLIVDAVRAVDGVFGARITGGGFGGCAIALVRSERVEAAREAVERAWRPSLGRSPPSFVTAAADGAGVLLD